MSRLFRALTYPEPYRAQLSRRIIKRLRLGSYLQRLEVEAVERPWYGWCVYYAAVQARALGHGAMTVVEMGVAGGMASCAYATMRMKGDDSLESAFPFMVLTPPAASRAAMIHATCSIAGPLARSRWTLRDCVNG
jgi:hypothetical protein